MAKIEYHYVLNGAEQLRPEGKWTPSISTYRITEGDSYICNQVEGGFGFDTEQLAIEAGTRAVETVKSTGMYPNMCAAY